MELQGKLIIWGSLILCVGPVSVGAWLCPSALGYLLLTLGTLASIGWVVAAFFIINAMNSDI
jgi:hypothetical protein